MERRSQEWGNKYCARLGKNGYVRVARGQPQTILQGARSFGSERNHTCCR